uniref:MAT1-1-4 n=1 Tax=Neofusicoccum cordaticola TaxID=643000 RepID=A0A343JZL3_9PEZI|nr:MAT1-1-4 [Neofusicoccum cordaticola]ATA58179.1 MAT1-1-4 [Neofusicoccum cordaticola]
MNGISGRMWQPNRGLLPLEEFANAGLPNPPPTLPGRPKTPDQNFARGSHEHLDALLGDLQQLCIEYCINICIRKPLTSAMESAFEKIMAECLQLLDPPNTIVDPDVRSQFFKIVRSTAKNVMEVAKAHQDLKDTLRAPLDKAQRVMEASSGYKDGLPRWSQFLALNAPGAKKLQLQKRNYLQPQRRGYQVLPQGGIGILRHWDTAMINFITDVDPQMQMNLWAPRFDWGTLGLHRLALGVRRFDPLKYVPSPWAMKPRMDNPALISRFNGWHMELEQLDSAYGSYIDKMPHIDEIVNSANQVVANSGPRKIAFTLEEATSRSSDIDEFNFILVHRFIRDDELTRLRERETISPAERKKMDMRKKRQGLALQDGNPPQSGPPQAGPSNQAGPSTQAATSSTMNTAP